MPSTLVGDGEGQNGLLPETEREEPFGFSGDPSDEVTP